MQTPFISSNQAITTILESSSGQAPGYNIWRTDGTTNGTIALTDFPANSSEGPVSGVWTNTGRSDYSFGSLAYFPVKTDASGIELWRTDGTPGGTYLLKDINPSGDANPSVARSVNGTTYFYANDGTNGTELWRTDSTTAGTQIVQDLNPGSGGQPATDGIALGQTFFFSGFNGTERGLFTVCALSSPAIAVAPSSTIGAGPI